MSNNADDSGNSPDDSAAPTFECSSIVFDTDGHVSFQASDLTSGSFYTNGNFTVEFWAWFSDVDLSVSRTLLSLGSNSAWWIGVEEGDLVFRVEETEIRGDAPTSDWHHVALVKDESLDEIRMYVDEKLFSEVLPFDQTFPPPDDDELHLARSHGFSQSWESAMDQIRFAEAVNYSGASMSILDPMDTSDWQGVWHFDESLANALNGQEGAGSNYEFVDSCP